ncbi:MAG: MFS transporter [Anaerolineae bacterium]
MTRSVAKPANPMLAVLRERNFFLLWLGQGTSLLGDSFHFIALSWLVLQLTNADAFALGTVLAVAGIPRALFMLVGGAITDRFSPRTIMLISDGVRFLLSGLIMVLILTGTINLWLLYAIALLFGFVSAFFQPAAGAIMPALVPSNELQPANSVFQGSAQLVSFIGPVLAGSVIAWFGASSGASRAGTLGLAVAFGIDAFSFLVSVVTLWLMRIPTAVRAGDDQHAASVLESIRGGLAFVWNDPLMRWMFVVIAAANFLFAGPIDVGIPVLAKLRLPEGVAGFGFIIAAYGLGNLIGTVLSGMISPRRWFKEFTLVLLFAFGLGIAPFGWLPSAWFGVAIFLLLGIGNGYFSIILITLLQKRTPSEMMGRIMSLLMLANVGLMPISQAFAGAVVNVSLDALFIGAGILMLLVALWTTFSPTLGILTSQVEKLAATPPQGAPDQQGQVER